MFKENFNIDHTIAKELFNECNNIYDILPKIKEFIEKTGPKLNKDEFNEIKPQVWVHKSVTISDTATINPPCIIGENTEIRPGAFIRGSVLIGDSCVIGNSCEFKNSIIFDKAQIPHFNYVGDSIIGYHAHLGAGVITSNLKNDKSNIKINGIDTNLRKIGGLVGDNTDIGCNSVLCPGSVIGKNTSIYPLTLIRGVIPANSIMKDKTTIVKKENVNE